MKRVLIVSPHFPPSNFPDMHRVRQSLPYFRELGWEPVVLAVDPDFVEGSRDEHLLATVPGDVGVHRVRPLDSAYTRRVGLGSLALRSLGALRRAGDRLFKDKNFDLVYFSTTQFPVLVLGRYWKRRFGIPYVVDIQDPWRSDHYLERPRSERPPKFWLSYAMDAILEPIAMRGVGGLIAVSDGYVQTMLARYGSLRPELSCVVPFGGPEADFETLSQLDVENPFFTPGPGQVNVVYVGRGGHDMATAARGIFGALARGLRERPALFAPVKLYFIGTDYAPSGRGRETIRPLSEAFGIQDRVVEYPERVSYFTALKILGDADMAVLPGSEDPAYTASKIYPYILARRPLLAVFNERSSVVDVMRKTRAGSVATFGGDDNDHHLERKILDAWADILERLPCEPDTDWHAFAPYTASAMAARQVELFERVTWARPADSAVRAG